MNYLAVAIGGAIGSLFRYLLGTIAIKNIFPINTFITNILGAMLIGFFVGIFAEKKSFSNNTKLFFQTGLCGGFTTFSTFSLETIFLIENKNYILAFVYSVLSVVFCLIGVIIGKKLANIIY